MTSRIPDFKENRLDRAVQWLGGRRSLFLDDHGALFGLRDRVGRSRGLLFAGVDFGLAFAVVDVPHVLFLLPGPAAKDHLLPGWRTPCLARAYCWRQ